MHTLYLPEAGLSGGRIELTGDEAKHAARVKRLSPGDVLRVCDGRGLVLECEVIEARRSLVLQERARRAEPPPAPAVHVFACVPKGPRVAELVEGLSQCGAASFTPVIASRSIAEAGEARIERLRRVATESLKQCGRAHLLDVREPVALAEALASAPRGGLVFADGGCPPWRGATPGEIRLLIGPEGGWTDAERSAAAGAGAVAASFGPHTMRIETAAPVACAILMHSAAPV